MIARKNRFHGHGSLRYVYQHGSVVRDSHCSIKYIYNTKRTNYRLAVVVSKKTAKSAVVRNRIRRRVYEIFRLNLPNNAPYDVVVSIFSDKLADMPAEELSENILKLLTQAKMPINNGPQPQT